MNKKELRKEVLAYRDALSVKDKEEKSKQIIDKILQLDDFKKHRKCCCMHP